MLYADKNGNVYEHPYYRMAGFSGDVIKEIGEKDLIPMPEYSKLFFIPDCPPIGLDPATGKTMAVPDIKTGISWQKCLAVAAFPEPGNP